MLDPACGSFEGALGGGGTLTSQVKKEGGTQPYKSPLFILHMGETEARKKNVIYSRS